MNNIDITNLPIEIWEIEKLKEYEFNNKIHKAQQVESLAKSIKENGIENPLLIEEDGVIISGHGRLKAALFLGMKYVPVRVARGINSIQAKKLRISVNKTTSTQYDTQNLSLELSELKDLDINLDDIGLTVKEINVLSAQIEPISIQDISFDIPEDKIKNELAASDELSRIDDDKIPLTKALKQKHITIEDSRILWDYILQLEQVYNKDGLSALIAHAKSELENS